MHHIAGASLLNQSKENFSAAGKTAKNLSILFQVKVKKDVLIIAALLKYWAWKNEKIGQVFKKEWIFKTRFYSPYKNKSVKIWFSEKRL